jgi:serine/threonine protein kinase
MLQVHQRLGEFEILGLLGRGGMGEVYEAQQFSPNRRVALKVLAPWFSCDEDALRRFWREAEVPAQLDHPNIVRIFSTGRTDDGTAYYTMQLVRGMSLAEVIRRAREAPAHTTPYVGPEDDTPTRSGPAPEPDPALSLPLYLEYRRDRYRTLARIGAAVARALGYAHRRGFMHRDLKPSNLMVDFHDQVYVVDFGLTRALETDAQSTLAGSLTGTPLYMSPEQADGKAVDARSDVYSLGVTLYELATQGEGPYPARRQDKDAVLVQVRAGQSRPLRSLASDVPPRLEAIVQRALHPDPERRYQKAEELADDLDRFLEQPGEPAPNKRRARPRMLMAAVLILAVVVGGASWTVSALRREPPGPHEQAADGKKRDGESTGEDPTKHDGQQPDKQAAPTLREFFKRERPVKTVVPLLRADNQPARCKQLLGQPTYTPMSKELILFSRPDDHKPSLLALDDPGEENFEFSVEMRHWGVPKPDGNELGLFFGWRDNLPDPLDRPRFFAVQLDPRPDELRPNGRLTVGTWRFEEPKDARAGMSEQNIRVLFGPKDGPRGIVPLPAPRDKRVPYYRVWVRVVNNKITVGVEDEQPIDFDVAWMLNNDKWLRTYSLDPHGALGIWTRNGQACFRNPTLMALPKDQ